MITPLKKTALHDLLNKPILFDANIFMVGISDRGEVFSLAYAAYHNMNYFCSKEIMVDNVARELEELKDVDIITFDIILLQAYVYYAQRNDNSNSKGLKSIYKKYCADVIKRHGLPATLGEYIKASQDYL